MNVFIRTLRWLCLMSQSHPTTVPVQALHGILQCFSNPTGLVRGPCWTHKGAVRYLYGYVRESTQPEFAKIPHGHRMWPYGPLAVPHGLFMGCLWYLNLYGARKFIMHALKLYGSRTGRQNSYGAARVSYGPREWAYYFCSKQAGTARTGPDVMWHGHYSKQVKHLNAIAVEEG